MDGESHTESYNFSLEKVDRQLDEADIRRVVEQAVAEAVEAMRREEGTDIAAQAEVLGAFGGIGTLAVTLLLSFGSGFAKKAGEDLYEKYLAPRLRQKNLIPKAFGKSRHNGGKKR